MGAAMGMSSTTGDLTWAGPWLGPPAPAGCGLGGQKSALYPGGQVGCGGVHGEAQGKGLGWKAQPLWMYMAER